MNRIVLIGNGFDLAHGLPSRYEDFVLHLINDAINEVKKSKSAEKYKQLFVLFKNPSSQNLIEIIDIKVPSIELSTSPIYSLSCVSKSVILINNQKSKKRIFAPCSIVAK